VSACYAHLYSTQTLVLQELHKEIKAGEHYNIDIATRHTCEVCIITFFVDAERHVEEKRHTAERDCTYCALMSDSMVQTAE